MTIMQCFFRTVMGGVPGTASDIFAAVKDVGANVIMISQGSVNIQCEFWLRRKWKQGVDLSKWKELQEKGEKADMEKFVQHLLLGLVSQSCILYEIAFQTWDKIIKIEGIFRECGLNLELSDIPVESLVPGIESCDKDIQGSQDHSGRIDEERNGESMLWPEVAGKGRYFELDPYKQGRESAF
ncbi:bifunctional aspartokinase/homoserine dehydrogenase 2, chloroplastic [Tanacetum coccineum]